MDQLSNKQQSFIKKLVDNPETLTSLMENIKYWSNKHYYDDCNNNNYDDDDCLNCVGDSSERDMKEWVYTYFRDLWKVTQPDDDDNNDNGNDSAEEEEDNEEKDSLEISETYYDHKHLTMNGGTGYI